MDFEIKKRFPKSKVIKAVEAMGEEAERILRFGFSGKGRQAAKLSKRYLKVKMRYADSGKYAAKKATDKYRLTGALLRSVDSTVTQAAQFSVGKVNVSFRVFVGKDQAEKVGWLLSTKTRGKARKKSRDFFSVLKGTSNKKKLRQSLINVFLKKLGVSSAKLDGATFRVK